MSAITSAVASLPTARGLERVAYGLLLAFVASLQVSIAAANILLAATALCFVAARVHHEQRSLAPSFFLPLVMYAAATLLSVRASRSIRSPA